MKHVFQRDIFSFGSIIPEIARSECQITHLWGQIQEMLPVDPGCGSNPGHPPGRNKLLATRSGSGSLR